MSTNTPVTHAAGGIVCYAQEGIGLVVSASEHNKVYADMQARAEAAEALVVQGKQAVNAAILYMGMDSESEDFDEAQFHRLRDETRAFLATSPAETRSVIAGLRKEIKQQADRVSCAVLCLDSFEKLKDERDALRAQLAALISAGNRLDSLLHDTASVFQLNLAVDPIVSAWEAAVSGASDGAKGSQS